MRIDVAFITEARGCPHKPSRVGMMICMTIKEGLRIKVDCSRLCKGFLKVIKIELVGDG